MKTSVSKYISCMIASILFLTVSYTVSAQTNTLQNLGAKGALQDSSITLEKALTYALQDEYAAQARCDAVIQKFGAVKPFVRIKKAEQSHIETLLPLFKAYKVPVPKNQAANLTEAPVSLKAAFRVGIEKETDHISMYTKLLETPGIPADVQRAMTTIRHASLNHLAAFQAGLSRSE
ncbi:hypothetical protein [Ectobacillus funiculus]|uniref:DUF2202 domain-containing protein n=1 Tax=Ectobacillus funiculus TaxID=137993 RepID=A0ABV5WEH2_9BACI